MRFFLFYSSFLCNFKMKQFVYFICLLHFRYSDGAQWQVFRNLSIFKNSTIIYHKITENPTTVWGKIFLFVHEENKNFSVLLYKCFSAGVNCQHFGYDESFLDDHCHGLVGIVYIYYSTIILSLYLL